MNKILYIGFFFCNSFLAMQQNPDQPIVNAQSHRPLIDHIKSLYTAGGLESIEVPSSLEQYATECSASMNAVLTDDTAHEKFARALDFFSQQAQNTPKFCAQWKKNWKFQWTAAAKTKVERAKIELLTESTKHGLKHAPAQQLETNLNHAIEILDRILEFDKVCQHFSPASN